MEIIRNKQNISLINYLLRFLKALLRGVRIESERKAFLFPILNEYKLKGMGVTMNRQTDVEVIINGKQYTLSGYESEEYIQKVASYINNKYTEFKQRDFYRQLDSDMRNVLLHINITDDYFKLKKQLEDTVYISDSRNNEIFELKHELIALQTKLESAQKEIELLKEAKLEEEKKNIRLETELSESKKTRK